MGSEPEYLVQWKVTTRFLTGSKSRVQFVKVGSAKEAREVAKNIREDAEYIDVSQGIFYNSIDYIKVYSLVDPVEL